MILYWTNSVSEIYISYEICLSLCILFNLLFPNIEKIWYIDNNGTRYHKKYVNVIGLKYYLIHQFKKSVMYKSIIVLRKELEVLMIILYSYVKRRKEMNVIEYTYLNTILCFSIYNYIQHSTWIIFHYYQIKRR